MNSNVNRKYIVLQGLFWALYCVAGGYISLCLLDRGLDNQEIGIVTAVFGTVSAIFQPLLGRICDRNPKMNWKKVMISLTFPFTFFCMLMILVPGKIVGIIAVGVLLFLGNTMIPFLNSALSDYRQQNIVVNFGIARGTGSIMYAIVSLIIGHAAASLGVNIVFVIGVLISLLFLLAAFRMPCSEIHENLLKRRHDEQKRSSFIRRYPAFIVMFTAFGFLSTSHYMVGTYLLQLIQSIGGTSKEYGTAAAIMAVVEVPILFGFSWVMKKLSIKKIMVISAFGFLIKTIWYAAASSISSLYFAQLVQMMGFGLFASASVYYAMEEIEAEDQVTGQALMASLMAIGTVLGSLIGGILIEQFNISVMLKANCFVALVGMILAVFSAAVMPYLYKGDQLS